MSSAEELTLVVGRWLRPIIMLLYVVRRSRAERKLAPQAKCFRREIGAWRDDRRSAIGLARISHSIFEL